MKTAIGVDVGGTKISMVLGTAKGQILAHRMISTQTGNKTRACVLRMIEEIKILTAEGKRRGHKVMGVGVGIPGPVNRKKGIVPCSPHLAGWQNLPLAALLRKKTGLRAVLANDANAAALGEKIFGQGRGVSDFVYLTVSTGIGGGIISQGKLLEGASWVAGEAGHMTIHPHGAPCKCGKAGCLEAYASGTAMARVAVLKMKKGRKSSIKSFAANGGISGKSVGLAAAAKDPLALEIFREAGDYLGVGVANLLNILNPQKVILGGGVFQSAPPVFWQSMLRACKREAWPDAYRAVKIVRTKIARVGDLGALALVFEHWDA